MTTLAEKRQRYCRDLEDSLRDIVDRLSQVPEVEKIILFGSYSEGRRDLLTDLDIAVVMDSDKPFLERSAQLRNLVGVNVDLDLLVYTPVEWQQNSGRPFFRNILSNGKVLYEKPN
jgi:predicted nucleotidyltransferase